ncbi:MAG: hypothetical protein IT443_02395 [Phycisphaeraceae bacterium]|nr:hypothetical protein [Phycisphaeraceae bacterium]
MTTSRPSLRTFGFALTLTLSAAILTPAASAQTGPGLLISPWQEKQSVEFSLDARYIDDAHVKGTTQHYTSTEYDSVARWRLDTENPASPVIGHEIVYFHNTTGRPDMVDQSAAVGMTVGQWQDWTFSVIAGVGFAGYSVYEHEEAIYAKGDLIASHDLDEKSSLILMLDYNGNRAVLPDIPLPGIAYQRRESDTLSYTLGLPRSSVTWKPAEQWTVNVAYTLPLSANANVDFEFVEHWHLFAMFENKSWAFHNEDQDNQRLLIEQKRLEAGLRWQVCPNSALVLAGGYAFDTRESFGFDRLTDRGERWVSDEPYVRAGFDMNF